MFIINLTQHIATPEQIAEGVVEPHSSMKKKIQNILTFNKLPSMELMETRAEALCYWAYTSGYKYAMVGGAPYFMSVLDPKLRLYEIHPLYSFSIRESIEIPQDDGSVKKTSVFKHIGFVGLT